MSSFRSRSGRVTPSSGRFTVTPMAWWLSWAQIRISARSKRGSEMPGIAISSWPPRKPLSMTQRIPPERGKFKVPCA